MNWFRCLVGALLLAILLSSPVCAVKMSAEYGFGNICIDVGWIPINVTLENNTDRDVSGYFAVRLFEYSYYGQGNIWRAVPTTGPHVYLPAGSRKEYQIYTILNRFQGQSRVLLMSGDRAVALAPLEPIQITNVFNSLSYAVLTVGAAEKKLAFLQGTTVGELDPHQGGSPENPSTAAPPYMSMPAPGSGTASIKRINPTQVVVDNIPQNNLPERPGAYKPINMLILSDFSVSTASTKMLNSIKSWVASGGTLVIPSGADYGRLNERNFYGELLPVKILGIGQSDGIKILESECKAPPIGPIALCKAEVIPERAIYSVRDSTGLIWAVRNYGFGKVVFLAFDPGAQPFRNWNGQLEFWTQLISTPAVYSARFGNDIPFASNSIGSTEIQLIKAFPTMKMPPNYMVWGFFALYIVVLVPLNYYILRDKKRLELAWITVPAIVLIFTLGAYGISYGYKGGKLYFNQASVLITSSGARTAFVSTATAIFSPVRKHYKVSLDDDLALGLDVGFEYGYENESSAKIQSIIDSSGKQVWEKVPMSMWSSRYFSSNSGIDLSGTVDANITVDAKRIQGTISNSTKYSFNHCSIIHKNKVFEIANLPAGKTIATDIAFPQNKPKPSETESMNMSEAAIAEAVSRNLYRYQFSNDPLLEKMNHYINERLKHYGGTFFVANTAVSPVFSLSSEQKKEENVGFIVVKLSK